MTVAFACVSAHELRGGPVVSPCLIYHICLSHSPHIIHTLNSFMSPTTYFSHSKSWLWWVTTAIDIILTPQALSTDADRKGGEWYPNTKFIADILKENGKTKLVGEGLMWYCKTLNANILRENDKTKLVGVGLKLQTTPVPFDPNHTPDNNPASDPCYGYLETAVNCMRSEKMSDDEILACYSCLDEAWNKHAGAGTKCDNLKEVGYCNDVFSCEAKQCNNECTDEINTNEACLSDNNGCNGYYFESECLSGI